MKSFTRKPTGPRPVKKPVAPRVPRTRNLNTETESQHMGKIRAALRNLSRWWKPISAVRKGVQVGRGKAARYYCQDCQKLVPKVEVDHIHPAGSLKTYADLQSFCERLFVEDIGLLRALCPDCHSKITHGKEG